MAGWMIVQIIVIAVFTQLKALLFLMTGLTDPKTVLYHEIAIMAMFI